MKGGLNLMANGQGGIKRYGSYIDKSWEATGVEPPPTKMPYGKGKVLPRGGVARPWTGPRPWADKTKSSEPANGNYEHNSPAKPL